MKKSELLQELIGKGIGEITATKIVEDVAKLAGGMDEVYRKVHKGEKLFTPDQKGHINKNIDKVIKAEVDDGIISRNFRLSSYEALSRELLEPKNTEMIEKRKHVEKIMMDNSIVPYEKMKTALDMNKIIFNDDELEVIYHGHF